MGGAGFGRVRCKYWNPLIKTVNSDVMVVMVVVADNGGGEVVGEIDQVLGHTEVRMMDDIHTVLAFSASDASAFTGGTFADPS